MKTLYIVRGLAGSGKSTLAEKLAPDHNYSADDFFVNQWGVYNFNPKLLTDAHNACLSNVLNAMEAGAEFIAVANTFSQTWEAEGYLIGAKDYGYQVNIIECQNNFGSIHDVPAETISRMKDRWETIRREV